MIAAEDVRGEQTERSRTKDLLITTVEDLEERTEQMNVTYLSDYVRREQPRGRMRWERKTAVLSGPTFYSVSLVAGQDFNL